MSQLPHAPFGSTGFHVSPLGIGSLAVSRGEDLIVRQMNALLDAGANLVDTAQCYPGSEELIGRNFAHRREEFILVSKCGHHDVLPDGSMRSKSISMADIDGALTRLRTDRLDVMLLHSYDFDLLVKGEALEVLQRAKEAGKILKLGYSGDNERLEWAVTCPLVDVVETSISLVDQANLARAVPHAAERGVGVIVKRPIANAAWKHTEDPEAANEHHRVYAGRFARMGLVAEEFGCASMAELAMRFLQGVEGVSCAIVSCGSPEHLKENVRIACTGPLSASDVKKIRQRFLTCETLSGGEWSACN